MLNSHKDLAIPGETHYFPQLIKFLKENEFESEENKRRHVYKFITESVVFKQLQISKKNLHSNIYSTDINNINEIVAVANITYSKEQGKSRWGDKTPDYVLNLIAIKEVFPNAYIVHLVRDGRDVALSYMTNIDNELLPGPETIIQAAKYWKIRVSAGKKLGKELFNDRYIEIRYEDLLNCPEDLLKSLCGKLNIEFDPNMLNYQQSAKKIYFDELTHHRNLQKEILSDNTKKWKTKMSNSDKYIFHKISGNLLIDLGYEKSNNFNLHAVISILIDFINHLGKRVFNYAKKKNKKLSSYFE